MATPLLKVIAVELPNETWVPELFVTPGTVPPGLVSAPAPLAVKVRFLDPV